MKMKKVLAVLLAASMTLSLAACGSGDKDSKSTSGKSDVKTESGASSSSKEEESSAPVTLNVTTTFAGNDGNAQNYQDAIAAWQEETGNTINDASATSDETFKSRVLADFEVGSEPDVLFFFNGVDSNAFVEAGKVVSIDEIRAEYPDYASNMKDELMGASPVDGKNYSVPVNGYWEGLYVNKEVCEKANVEIPGPDTTWNEFMEICQKIKDAGFTPIAAALGDVPHYWFEFAILNHQKAADHATLPTSADDAAGTAWVEGINDIKDLYEKGFFPENTLSGKDDETFQMFIDGKAAFLLDGSWKTGGIEGATENIDNFTVTYCPGMNDRKATDIVSGLSSGFYISKKAWDDPDKRKAAVDFVTYMTTDEMVTKFAQISATALKNGVQLDESTLNNLQKDGLAMVNAITGLTSAVQDQIPTECRVPVFDGMANLVTGKVEIKEAVQNVIDLLAEVQK